MYVLRTLCMRERVLCYTYMVSDIGAYVMFCRTSFPVAVHYQSRRRSVVGPALLRRFALRYTGRQCKAAV